VYGDWSVLAELFLGLVHLSDEVDESLAGLGNTLLRPVGELELAQRPRLTVLRPQSSAATGQSCNKSDLVSRKKHEKRMNYIVKLCRTAARMLLISLERQVNSLNLGT